MTRPPLPQQGDDGPWGEALNAHVEALGAEHDALEVEHDALEVRVADLEVLPPPGGITVHADLTGLSANDHPQYQLGSAKGVAGGYASLGGDGKVPSGQLPSASGVAASVARYVPVVIINGESNSGGYADNNQALASELLARPAVQIFDNTGLSSFQDLDIGTNNLVDHAGLSNGPTHGWELALANSVEEGQWWDDTVYLIKTGQGGSTISQWNVGGAYYTKFLDRVRNGLALLRGQGKVPVIYVWYSLGINDAIAGTNEATWMSNIQAYFTRIRKELGHVPIFSTQFMAASPGVNFNDSVAAMAAADNMCFAIDASGTTTRDANHWDYAGMKLMGSRLISASLAFGQHEGYMARRVDMLAGGNVIAPPGDLPNLLRSPASVSFVEGSSGGTFVVSLSTAPAANVVVSVTASGAGNITPSPASLTFTPANYSSSQTVTLTSPDDGAQNGSRSSTITLSSVGVTAPATVSATATDAFVNPGPINSVLPAITGATTLGAVVTCSQGTWSGTPTSYAYQWKRDALDIAGQTANTHTITAADQGHVLICTVSATNAQGTNSATTTNFTVPADAGSYVPYAWKNLTAATESNNQIVSTGSMPGGGNATDTIDATQAFRVKAEFATQADASGAVIHFEDTLDYTNFTWGGAQVFVAGMYYTTGKVYTAVNGTANSEIVGWSPTFPLQIRAEKSGNDVVWSSSPDGLVWTTRATQTGVLSGKTVIQPRVLFAIATANQKVKVSYDSSALAPTAPVNTVLPALSGSTAAGGVLTASTGTWTQTPTAYAYQWKRDGSDLAAETTNQHTVVVADEGHDLTCAVTATNAQGAATATSAATAIPVPSLPANTVLPAITGSASLGGVLTCSTGTWTGGVASYAYQWKRDGADIVGETVATHTVVSADQAHDLTCAVTATNGVGSVSATSAATAVPAASAMVPFTYQNLTNATVDGSAYVVSSGTGATGANAVEPVDVTQPFTIIIDWDSSVLTSAVVVMLDDDQSTNFTWSGQLYTTCAYNTSGTSYSGIDAATPLNWSWTPVFPCKIRMTKSGNDVLYHSSTDGGGNWALRYTHTGRLSGKSTQYVRVLFAVAATGQKVKVSYDSAGAVGTPPANVAAPAITGTSTAGSTLTCSTGTWSGTPTDYAYQWKRDGSVLSGETASTYVVVAADESHSLVCTVTATNANGSTPKDSGAFPVPVPGLTWNDVVWTAMASATSPSAGRIDGASTGAGGLATTPLDLTKYWEVEVLHEAPMETSNASVCFIDEDNTASFGWNASQLFLIGEYQYNGAHTVAIDGGATTPDSTGKSLTAPFRVKMVPSGNDVAFYYGAGATGSYEGSPFFTKAGRLTGKTTGYIKALFAAGAGSLTVRYAQGA